VLGRAGEPATVGRSPGTPSPRWPWADDRGRVPRGAVAADSGRARRAPRGACPGAGAAAVGPLWLAWRSRRWPRGRGRGPTGTPRRGPGLARTNGRRRVASDGGAAPRSGDVLVGPVDVTGGDWLDVDLFPSSLAQRQLLLAPLALAKEHLPVGPKEAEAPRVEGPSHEVGVPHGPRRLWRGHLLVVPACAVSLDLGEDVGEDEPMLSSGRGQLGRDLAFTDPRADGGLADAQRPRQLPRRDQVRHATGP
jgi:hypothetical protein